MIKQQPLKTSKVARGCLAANDDHPLSVQAQLREKSRARGVAANDDWMIADLPLRLEIMREEVLLLDGMMRDQILALFVGEVS